MEIILTGLTVAATGFGAYLAGYLHGRGRAGLYLAQRDAAWRENGRLGHRIFLWRERMKQARPYIPKKSVQEIARIKAEQAEKRASVVPSMRPQLPH